MLCIIIDAKRLTLAHPLYATRFSQYMCECLLCCCARIRQRRETTTTTKKCIKSRKFSLPSRRLLKGAKRQIYWSHVFQIKMFMLCSKTSGLKLSCSSNMCNNVLLHYFMVLTWKKWVFFSKENFRSVRESLWNCSELYIKFLKRRNEKKGRQNSPLGYCAVV